MRLILDMVRGKKVEAALSLLRFTPTPNASIVAKVIKSAASNAENGFQLSVSKLKIMKIFADDAPVVKRYIPRSRGRVSPIHRRSSHITVILAEEGGYGTQS